ncbi:hypothetical protein [Pusillimonas sp. T2]|nr:hypothetical protein [Pusillimonas sp. T2]
MKTRKDASDTANYVGVVDMGSFLPVKNAAPPSRQTSIKTPEKQLPA